MIETPEDVNETRTHTPSESELLLAKATIEYRSEFVRKLIHLCSLSIPVIYYFIHKDLALLLLVPTFLAFFIVDLIRLYHAPTGTLFLRWFGWLLRKHEYGDEAKRLTGATNILFSAIVCVLLFPKIIAINAFAILIISDTTSALIGRRFGKHRFLSKSLEGTVAFIISAAVVVFLAPKISGSLPEYGIGLFAAAVGGIVEASSTKIDDNISVPIAIGAVLWALYALLLPALNLSALA